MTVPDKPRAKIGAPRKWRHDNAHEAVLLLDNYLAECSASKATPHIVGAANAIGLHRSEWYTYESEHDDVPEALADAMKRVRRTCEEALTTGLIDGKTTPVGKIFVAKALMGWRDGSEDDNRRNGSAIQVVINTTPEALGMATAQVIEATRVVDALPVNDTADMQTVDADR